MTLEAYPATNIRINFVIKKLWQIFILSALLPPSFLIVMAGGAETMYNQITFIFSKE